MRRLILCTLLFVSLHPAIAEEGVLLNFDEAWRRILLISPSIAAADAEIALRRGEAEQVSLLPNPVASVEEENIGITHPTDDTEPPQTTFSVSQLIELGGKRKARRALACSVTDEAAWAAMIERENLLQALKVGFVETSVAQEKVRLARERLQLAEKVRETVKAQVSGGKVSPIQEKRAELSVMMEQIAVREALSTFEQAKLKIAGLWGSACPDFEGVCYSLFEFPTPPDLCFLLEGYFETPDFKKMQQQITSARYNLRLQKVNAIPDVNVQVGYTAFNDSSEGGFILGVAMPLPFFNRNQGNVHSACANLSQTESLLEEQVRAAHEQIEVMHARLAGYFEESEIIQQSLLVEAKATYALVEEGHQKGKIDFIELLEARRALFEVQQRYVEILSDYHICRAELARLSGGQLCKG